MRLRGRHAALAPRLALALAGALASSAWPAEPPNPPVVEDATAARAKPQANPSGTRVRGSSVLRQRYVDVINAEPDRRMEATEMEEYFRSGQRLEQAGRLREALNAYLAAARAGHGPAQKRLGILYGRGGPDVPRDYAESVHWYQRAKRSGEDVAEPLQYNAPR